jgi:TetR/AcrR family transcriptional repressor of lmrAB and yxaGH operons
MGRRSNVKARMIEAADELIRSRGYLGTALTDIVSVADTPRGSIYFHFPGGKEEVAVAVTLGASATLEETVDRAIDAATSPGDVPRYVAADFAKRMDASDFKDGCVLAPVVLEMATESEVLRDACRLAFDRWRRRLSEGYEALGIPAERAEILATMTISTLEGALVVARAQRDVQSILAMGEELAVQVDLAAASQGSDATADA